MTQEADRIEALRTSQGFRIEKNIMVPMRDGVRLATDIWMPEGGAAPTLVFRTPYGKDGDVMTAIMAMGVTPNLFALVEAGYALVFQDCRGTHRSEGTFTPLAAEGQDGYDALAWIQDQSWCDGNIGMIGASYHGYAQLTAAANGAPGLKAIAPACTNGDLYTGVFYSHGGAMSWQTALLWSTLMAVQKQQRAVDRGEGSIADLAELAKVLGALPSHLEALPAADQPALEKHLPWWRDWLDHPGRDSYWQEMSVVERLGSVTTPALHIVGWFDFFINGTLDSYTEMKNAATSPESLAGQQLIIGPWDHIYFDGSYHDRNFGPAAAASGIETSKTFVQYFDRWLRGHIPVEAPAPVRIFVMGIDEWRDEQEWPLPDTDYVPFYLDSAGAANTKDGDGVLRSQAAQGSTVDTIVYDPRNPVPSVGGRTHMPAVVNGVGPVDQQVVESREDVLVYSTEELLEPIEVTGPLSLVLHVSSSAQDTDFTAKLVDVFPDGRAIYLTDGILRARYRSSLEKPELLIPGEEYELTINLGPTSNVFLQGHRIRLEVSSSCFPRYDRNTNTGGEISKDGQGDLVTAVNKVVHGPHSPSRLILPIIRR